MAPGGGDPLIAVVELVVFDFDGTLTRTDTLLPFLATVDPVRTARHAPAAVAAAKRRRSDRDRLKEQLIGQVLAGRSSAEVVAHGERFVRRILPRLLRRDVVGHLAAHRRAGRVLALASASPDVVVEPAARLLGVDQVVCTRLAPPDERGPWRFRSGNCRGPEKLDQVERVAGRLGVQRLWAYGNLPDDAPLLSRADVAVTVARQRLQPLVAP